MTPDQEYPRLASCTEGDCNPRPCHGACKYEAVIREVVEPLEADDVMATWAAERMREVLGDV